MQIKAWIRWFIRQLLELLGDVPRPGKIALTVTGEKDQMLTFKINLPALPDPAGDIASGELTVKVNGESSLHQTTKEQASVDGLSGNEGETVEASFVWIDDAGNKSQVPSTLTVVLTDTIAPPNAGELSLEVTGEL